MTDAWIEDLWLAEQFGRPCFRLDTGHGIGDVSPPPTEAPAWFAYARLAVGEVAVARTLAHAGFYLVDTPIILERRGIDRHDELPHDPRVRLAEPGDADRVATIARDGFAYSRFHADPEIPDGVANRVKAAWAENYFNGGRGDALIVAETEGGVQGFLLLLDSKTDTPVIDLVAVGGEARNQGLGRAMLNFVPRVCPNATTIRVGTQLANVPSVQMYQACGYLVVGSAHLFHWHAGPGLAE